MTQDAVYIIRLDLSNTKIETGFSSSAKLTFDSRSNGEKIRKELHVYSIPNKKGHVVNSFYSFSVVSSFEKKQRLVDNVSLALHLSTLFKQNKLST